MQTTTLYEQDFYAWTQRQIELLRSGIVEGLDLDNLAEELESMRRQLEQELDNRMGVLLGHLLKWHYQPESRSKSWRATIQEQRFRIARLIKKNPSVKPYLPEAIEVGYILGLSLIDRETPLDSRQLPQNCPFSDTQIFDGPVELDQF
jgi:Domain of unknown function DUF29